ncbi:MAG: two-component sensor histidine kinase, partial [Pseudonocardia sp.]|nr:two-component sensor histidine kinase [Pseudonocardia sp.]
AACRRPRPRHGGAHISASPLPLGPPDSDDGVPLTDPGAVSSVPTPPWGTPVPDRDRPRDDERLQPAERAIMDPGEDR